MPAFFAVRFLIARSPSCVCALGSGPRSESSLSSSRTRAAGPFALARCKRSRGQCVAMKRAADLQEALPERPAHRHPDGPSVLNGGDVLADLAAILGRQAFKPVSDRLGAQIGRASCRERV